MRVKQILAMFSIPANIRLVYSRITSSRLTTAFFVLSFLHFILQVSFQSWAFQINSSAGTFLSDILTAGNLAPHSVFAVLVPMASDGKSGGELRVCNKEEMEAHEDIYECPVVWKGRVSPSPSGTDDGYGATPTVSTSTSAVVSTPSSGGPVAQSGVSFIPKEEIRVVTPVDDEHDDDDDEEEHEEDDRRRSLVPRDHDLAKVQRLSNWRRDIPVESVFSDSLIQPGSAATQSTLIGVRLPNMMNVTTGTMGVVLREQCVQMILWPNQIIHNTKREDLTFIGFQLWVLGMSTVAILNESIPHTLAALATHLLTTIWSGYQLVNTASFQSEFVRSTIRSGLCGNANLLPSYWVERRAAEISVLVVNVVSLLISAGLSWRLVKMFGWQTFKRIGASLEINRIYKIVLTFSIGLQVAFFFIVAAVALWLDVLFETILGATAENVVVYKTFGILSCILMVPWLCLGWFAVRREAQSLMCLFLAASLLVVAAWGSLFMSRTFRWEFMEWRFFAVMMVASAVLLVITTILGVVCFYNFGKGLKRFLATVDEQSFNRDNFIQVGSPDLEKPEVIDFPVSGPIPTYAVAFGNTNPKQDSPVDRSNSLRSLSSTASSGLGSPLHDPVFFDPSPDYPHMEHPHLQVPTSNVPPRFRSRENSTIDFNGSSISHGATVGREDSLTSTESGSNPFSLDTGSQRDSVVSGASGRTYGTNKSARTYANPAGHVVPPKHIRDNSQANSLESSKRWVID